VEYWALGEKSLDIAGAFRLQIVNGRVEGHADAPAGVIVGKAAGAVLTERDDVLVRLNSALATETLTLTVEGKVGQVLHIDRHALGDAAHVPSSVRTYLADGASAVLVLPAVDPLNEPLKFDPAEQFDAALKNRLELGQQQIRIDSAASALNVAENNLMPELNPVGTVSFVALGGAWPASESCWLNIASSICSGRRRPAATSPARCRAALTMSQRPP